MKFYLITLLKNLLRFLSRRIIQINNPDIIAITGTAGKTSTREAIFAVLANRKDPAKPEKNFWKVRRTLGNLNTELGMPLAIIGDWEEKDLKLVSRDQPAGTKKIAKIFFWKKVILIALWKAFFKAFKYPLLILEYGADRPGDIKHLLSIVRPRIGVVTAIGDIPVHVEFYEDSEAVAKEKGKLIESLSASGYAVLNYDDDLVMQMQEKTRAKKITFGFNNGADVKISNFENRSESERPAGVSFKIEYEGSFVPLFIKDTFGRAQAYNVAAAFAVGIIYNMNLVEIAGLIERYYIPAKRRMSLSAGIKESWIIDDSYNASPISTREALSALKELKAKRKVAVLGDMLELGKYSIEAHEGIGKIAAKSCDVLITVGLRAKFIAETAKESGMAAKKILSFDFVEDAIEPVAELIKKGDLVLVKASRGIELDKIADEIRQA